MILYKSLFFSCVQIAFSFPFLAITHTHYRIIDRSSGSSQLAKVLAGQGQCQYIISTAASSCSCS
jgi:hypothetical protein